MDTEDDRQTERVSETPAEKRERLRRRAAELGAKGVIEMPLELARRPGQLPRSNEDIIQELRLVRTWRSTVIRLLPRATELALKGKPRLLAVLAKITDLCRKP